MGCRRYRRRSLPRGAGAAPRQGGLRCGSATLIRCAAVDKDIVAKLEPSSDDLFVVGNSGAIFHLSGGSGAKK